jgi:hypothetical protein
MKYTKFFGQVNKDNGLQRISNSQLARIMNLAYLEGRLRGIKESSEIFMQEKNTRTTEVLTYRVARRITELTGNRDPRALMQEICYISEKEQ